MPGELQTATPGLPAIPWRDPHTVSPKDLAGFIAALERSCAENPQSADLRTCLGMAHAMNHDPYRSMDALEEARQVDPASFWAQMKYAELFYRLRALPKSEEETLRALGLAANAWEASLARRQLLEIRRLMREGTQRPAWTKPLGVPAAVLLLMTVILCVVVAWK